MLKKIKGGRFVIIILLSLLFLNEAVEAETSSPQISVRVNRERSLTQVFIKQGRSMRISYGYFTERHILSSGVVFSTVLIDEGNIETFMRLNAENQMEYFTVTNYILESFDVFYCNETSEARRRCDTTQIRFNDLNTRYQLQTRAIRSLGRRQKRERR